MQTDDTVAPTLEPSLSSPGRRIWRTFLAIVFVGAVITAGLVVFTLVTNSPGGAACDHLDDLGAEKTVKQLERYVSRSVVRMKLTDGYEKVEVTGCSQSMSTLSKTMSHKQFTKLTDCIVAAQTERAAAACF